ncbi:MAG: hypothetical protein AB7E36_06345 [Salinivirgaceae bacterium]
MSPQTNNRIIKRKLAQLNASNGWYAFDNWNPDDYTFNYEKGMVYNIAP